MPLGLSLGLPLGLFGPIGTPELLIILLVALLMFGGRLPEVAKSLGKSVNQFKKGLKEVDDEVSHPDAPAQQPPRSLPPQVPPASSSEPNAAQRVERKFENSAQG